MATKIILKKSNTVGAIPLSTDLEIGELAVNTADRKLYTKNNSNTVVPLGGAYVSATAPTSFAEGDLWYDTANDLLKVSNGTTWALAGTNTYVTSASFNTTTGVLTLTRNDAVTVTVDLDGKYAESSHTHTAAAITDFADAATDAVAGNIVGSGIVSVSYDHLNTTLTIGATEADTLDSVTDRGATTTNSVTVGGLTVNGDLTVTGTTTTINTNEVNIGDAVILLNSDEVGTPTQNAGIEIERGTSTNVSLLWDETLDVWTFGDQTVAGIRLDGGTY